MNSQRSFGIMGTPGDSLLDGHKYCILLPDHNGMATLKQAESL